MADFVSQMNHTRADPISFIIHGVQARAQLQNILQQPAIQLYDMTLKTLKLQQDQAEAKRRDEIGFYNAQTQRMQTEALIDQRSQPKYSDPLDQQLMQARIGSYERANQPRTGSSTTFTPTPAGVYAPGEVPQVSSEPAMPTSDGQYQATGTLFPNPNTASGMNEPSGDDTIRQLDNEILRLEQAKAANANPGMPPADSGYVPPAPEQGMAPQQQQESPVQKATSMLSKVPEGQIVTQADGQGGVTQYQSMNGVPMFRTYRETAKGIVGDSGWDKMPQQEAKDPLKAQMDQLDLEKKKIELEKLKSPGSDMNPGLKPPEKTVEEYITLRRKLALASAKPRMQGEPTTEQKEAAYNAQYGMKPDTKEQWQEAYNIAIGEVDTDAIQAEIKSMEEMFPSLNPSRQQAPRPTIPGAPPQDEMSAVQRTPTINSIANTRPMSGAEQMFGSMAPRRGVMQPQQPTTQVTLDDIKTPQEVEAANRVDPNAPTAQQNMEWTRAKQDIGSMIGKGVTRLKPETVSRAVAAMNSGKATDDDKAVLEALGIAKSIHTREMIMDGPNSTGFGGDFSDPTGTQAAFHYAKKLGIKPLKVAGQEIAPEFLLKAWAESLLTSVNMIGENANQVQPGAMVNLSGGVQAFAE